MEDDLAKERYYASLGVRYPYYDRYSPYYPYGGYPYYSSYREMLTITGRL